MAPNHPTPSQYNDDLHERIERLKRRMSFASLLAIVWDILYEQGNLGSVLDNLEDSLSPRPRIVDPPATCIECDAPFPTHRESCSARARNSALSYPTTKLEHE
jgi:hypothetical protein